MINWAIDACKESKYVNIIFVSSEDDEILSLAKKSDVEIIERPTELSKDDVWTQDVLKHAVNEIVKVLFSEGQGNLTLVVRVQANSPQVTGKKIDECIEKLATHNLWEVFTVNRHGIEDAAIHVLKPDCVFQNALSVYKGVVTTNYLDIHTAEDLKNVEQIMKVSEVINESFDEIEKSMNEFLISIKAESKKLYSWRIHVPILETFNTLLSKAEKDLHLIVENKNSNKRKKVLDLGCGFCPFWPFFEEYGFTDFAGVDLFSLRGEQYSGFNTYMKDAELFVEKFCKKDTRTRVIEADIRNLSDHLEEGEKFDLIFTSNTDYIKRGSTGIPLYLFNEVCEKYLAKDGIKIFNG